MSAYVLRATLVAVLLALAPSAAGSPASDDSLEKPATVERIVDGDTLVVRGGARIRLVQIDAPESGEECYAAASTRELARLAPPGTPVTLEADPTLDRVDRYGRLLRYVHAGGANVNLVLVRRGDAVVLRRGSRPLREPTPGGCDRRACGASGHVGRVPRLLEPLRSGRYPIEVEAPSSEGRSAPETGPSVRRLRTSSGRSSEPMTLNCDPVAETKREAAMTAAQFELIDETEAEAILRWRFEELVRAGYDIGSALVLASHVEIDLHHASALTRRGCPPETALQILL